MPTGPPPPTPETGRIGTEYAPGIPPPPAQPEGRRRRTILLVGGGCLVLLVLALIAFVSCLALIGSSGGGSDSKSKSSQSGASKQSAAAIGESVTVGDVTWTVTNARSTDQLTQQGVSKKNAKTEQGNFVVVDFDFTNNGSDPVTLDNTSLALIDGEGRESNPSSDQFFYVPRERQIFLENINPGVTRQGEAIFEVAPGASGFQLQAGDTNMFSDENGYVDLGF